jgi:hypothetical protein
MSRMSQDLSHFTIASSKSPSNNLFATLPAPTLFVHLDSDHQTDSVTKRFAILITKRPLRLEESVFKQTERRPSKVGHRGAIIDHDPIVPFRLRNMYRSDSLVNF